VGVSWIGGHDLDCFAATLTQPKREKLFTKPYTDKEVRGQGAVKTFVEKVRPDEIHLISNYDEAQSKAFAKWIGADVTLRMAQLSRPTDYRAVFAVADAFLGEVTSRDNDQELLIHLSSGTPAMAAVWVLLGKSRYPATFYQTFKGDATEETIPFDLQLDYLPQLLRDPDLNLQALAARSSGEVQGFERIVGDSKAVRLAVGRASKAAVRNVPILLLGESGTGKEVFARAIHDASPRRGGPFVPLNCAAIPRSLLESELFGHKKGAFTGATTDHAGAFEQADGGTLFLDEIGECDADMQAKLLRVLQPPAGFGPSCRVFRRVGDTEDRTSDVRVIAATNRNLLEAARENEFREDLYYRLAVVNVQLPPLRERRIDIPSLAKAFLDEINEQFARDEPGYEPRSLAKSAVPYLKGHDWPGNVRELRNVLLQAAVMSERTSLTREDLVAAGADYRQPNQPAEHGHELGQGFDLVKHLESIQRIYLQRAMEEAGGVKKRAAELLGYKHWQTLDQQLERLNVPYKKRLGARA
jgi:DNA-binding NtrC family response regulator